VLVDQPACLLKEPGWSDEECRQYGAVLTADEAREVMASIGGPDGVAATREFMRGMFTEDLSDKDFDFVIEQNLKFPRPLAAGMIWNVMAGDYRDLLPLIDVPALCVGGLKSDVPHESMSWMASQMRDADHEVLPGSHFMFFEEPESFNVIVDDFLRRLTH